MKKIAFTSSLILISLVSFGFVARAAYEQVALGDTITIGEFIYDDNFVATTTPCWITINDSGGSAKVTNATMTAQASGWHYYPYTVGGGESTGKWPSFMTCGSAVAGDLLRLDKSFIVISPQTTSLSTSSIATAVWNSVSRTLTDYAPSTIATAVWSNGTRSLTTIGSLAADIWNDTYAPVRRMTDSVLTGGGSLATTAQLQTTIQSATSTLLTNISSSTASIITEVLANRTLINNLNNISANDIWTYGARTLTSYGSSSPTATENADAVWNRAASALTSNGSIGKLLADNIDAAISSRGISNLTAADVWNATTRTLSGATLTDGGSLTTLSDFNTGLNTRFAQATSSIISEIMTNRTLINNLNNISAADVWAHSSRSLTNYGTSSPTAAENADAVWNRASNQLTSAGTIGKLLADNIDATISSRGISNLTAGDVWAAANRTLSDYSTSTIAQAAANAVWSSAARTLTNYGNDITGEDVWNVLYTSVQSAGSVGKLLSDNLDVPVSSRSTSTLTAAQVSTEVWNATTRTLSDANLTNGGTLSTIADLGSRFAVATSSIISEIQTNRTLINNLNNISAADVWAYGARTLTNYGSSSPTATENADAVWNRAASALTSNGSIGKLLADNIDAAISSRGISNLTATDIWTAANRTLSDYATSSIAQAASAAVWANASRSLTNYGNDITAADVWNTLTGTLTTANSVGKLVVDNIDAAISTRSTSTLTSNQIATDVWAATNRSLSTAALALGGSLATNADIVNGLAQATSSIIAEIFSNRTLINNLNNVSAADVWAFGSRSLTNYGTSSPTATENAEAVWNRAASQLTSLGSIGKLLTDNIDATISSRSSTTNSLTAADIWSAANRTLTDYGTSSIAQAASVAVWQNAARTLTNYGNDISAADVWNTLTSSLTSANSVGKLLADNIDVAISTRGISNLVANDVWNATNRTLSDYSTTTIAQAAAAAVWSNASRSLTSYGNDITAADVWNTLTSSLNAANSIGKLLNDNIDTTISSRATGVGQNGGWETIMSDYASVQTNKTYRAKVEVRNASGTPATPFAAPLVTLYDADRNVVVSSVGMTQIGTGLYEYTYLVPTAAAQGVWEAVISTQVESGVTLTNNDYWIVAGSPAQVIINSINTASAPSISANVTITNEGLTGYEYQYEWCVVSQSDNICGGGDDVYHATAAKFINPGEDWNTNLTATVPNGGSYYFKLVVYFGTEKSGSSRTFTFTGSNNNPPAPAGGGGGGGGGAPSPEPAACVGADFNRDSRVNSVDFSILLSFWKTQPPFRNTCVDINSDNKVDSVDFSIMLSQWGTAGRAYRR